MDLLAAASALLLAIGVLGALDIALFHVRAHALRRQPSARAELVTHALRGPTYAFLFVVVPNIAAHGAWFGAVLGVLGFDVAISIADFVLEKRSRAPLGGLPTGEYVLHSVIAILFGAFAACWAIGGAAWWELPTAWVVEPHVPGPVRILFGVMAASVLATGAADAVAVVRLGRAAR